MTNHTEDVEHLHINCVRALRQYIVEANKTCRLLNSIKNFPVTLENRLAIIEQRQNENERHSQDQIAREQLFRAAQWD